MQTEENKTFMRNEMNVTANKVTPTKKMTAKTPTTKTYTHNNSDGVNIVWYRSV